MSTTLQRFSPRKNRGFFLRAKRIQGTKWTVFYDKETSLGVELAVIVRKQICRKSSQRNKIKRISRELFRRALEKTSLKNHRIVVVWGRSSPPAFEEMNEIVKKISIQNV